MQSTKQNSPMHPVKFRVQGKRLKNYESAKGYAVFSSTETRKPAVILTESGQRITKIQSGQIFDLVNLS